MVSSQKFFLCGIKAFDGEEHLFLATSKFSDTRKKTTFLVISPWDSRLLTETTHLINTFRKKIRIKFRLGETVSICHILAGLSHKRTVVEDIK